MSNQAKWLTTWQTALQTSNEKELSLLLKDAPTLSDEQSNKVLEAALKLTHSSGNLDLLTEVFKQLDQDNTLRATALEVTLELADERKPKFKDLLNQLKNGEQVLVLANLLERCRKDSDPERQLFRLSLILDLIPEDVRSLYWSEATSLALLGGDDAQLILLKLANRLSRKARRSTFEELSEAVSRLKEPYKHAQAHALLLELGVPMSFLDIETAMARAKSIPDPALRAMTESRLVELSGSGS